MSAHIQITAGGAPDPAALAALTAAARTLLDTSGDAPADPRPAVYRSRWRRAGLLELTDVPTAIKDNGPAWGGTA